MVNLRIRPRSSCTTVITERRHERNDLAGWPQAAHQRRSEFMMYRERQRATEGDTAREHGCRSRLSAEYAEHASTDGDHESNSAADGKPECK